LVLVFRVKDEAVMWTGPTERSWYKHVSIFCV